MFGLGRIEPLGLQLLHEPLLMTDDAGTLQDDICGMLHDHATMVAGARYLSLNSSAGLGEIVRGLARRHRDSVPSMG
jgi:hypothetical protein